MSARRNLLFFAFVVPISSGRFNFEILQIYFDLMSFILYFWYDQMTTISNPLMPRGGPREWNSGMFECFNDIPICKFANIEEEKN